MNEFDDLISHPGVMIAGRFGPDGRVAEHKNAGLLIDNPAALDMAHWFCSAVTSMFTSMAAAMAHVDYAGSWLPMMSWTYWGGDYAIAVRGRHFVIAEAANIGSLDEVAGLLRELDS